MDWRLRDRLRIVVVGIPLALWGCEKKSRQATAAIDAAVVAVREVDAATAVSDGGRDGGPDGENALDGAVTTLGPDASVLKVPGAFVKQPALGMCGGSVRWCAPPAQATSLAAKSAKDVEGCASSIRIRQRGEALSLDLTRSGTKQKRAAGKDVCCYDWHSRCAKGRPLRGERKVAEVAGVRVGQSWSGRAATRRHGQQARTAVQSFALAAQPSV